MRNRVFLFHAHCCISAICSSANLVCVSPLKILNQLYGEVRAKDLQMW